VGEPVLEVSASGDRAIGSHPIEAWADETEDELRSTATRVADFIVQAAELDERAAALVRDRRDLDLRRLELEELIVRHGDAVAEIERREDELQTAVLALRSQFEHVEQQQRLVEQARHELAERAQLLAEQEREIEQRASRLHWRWLVRAWQWRPRLPGQGARVCELLFVPSPRGYRLLEQRGVALEREATLSGLLGEEMTYVVAKMAPWPLDGRWCAYLEQS
jgi:hypothetical protein